MGDESMLELGSRRRSKGVNEKKRVTKGLRCEPRIQESGRVSEGKRKSD